MSLFEAMVPCGTELARMDDKQLIRAIFKVKNRDEACGMVEGLLTLIGATVPPPEGHLVPESTLPPPGAKPVVMRGCKKRVAHTEPRKSVISDRVLAGGLKGYDPL